MRCSVCDKVASYSADSKARHSAGQEPEIACRSSDKHQSSYPAGYSESAISISSGVCRAICVEYPLKFNEVCMWYQERLRLNLPNFLIAPSFVVITRAKTSPSNLNSGSPPTLFARRRCQCRWLTSFRSWGRHVQNLGWLVDGIQCAKVCIQYTNVKALD
jgi:hypothetical protein